MTDPNRSRWTTRARALIGTAALILSIAVDLAGLTDRLRETAWCSTTEATAALEQPDDPPQR